MDRLLKPDMGLKNDAQNKKFIGDRTSSMNKQATVETFYVEKKSNSKSFLAIGQFFAKPFNSHSFHSKRSVFEVSSQQGMGNSRSAYATQTARGIRPSRSFGRADSASARLELAAMPLVGHAGRSCGLARSGRPAHRVGHQGGGDPLGESLPCGHPVAQL